MAQRTTAGGGSKALLFLVMALVSAAGAAVIVLTVIQGYQRRIAALTAERATVDVVVAAEDLLLGHPIRPEQVAVRALAPEMVPAGVVFSSVDMVVGRTPKERILANEVVRAERLADEDAGTGLNALIRPGMRAMSVFTTAESAVAGLIHPGNYVDVVVTIQPDQRDIGAKAVAKTVMQKIRVLAVGTEMNARGAPVASKDKKSGGRRIRPTVTLEVTPEQAEELALAAARGDIHLALRSQIDSEEVETEGAVATTLIGHAPKHPVRKITTMAAKAQPPRDSAVVIAGSEETKVVFDAEGVAEESVRRGGRRR